MKKIINTIKKSLLIFAIIGILVNFSACGAIKKFPHSVPGKALYYGLNAVRNPVGTAVALTAGAATGISAASIVDSAKKEASVTEERTKESISE